MEVRKLLALCSLILVSVHVVNAQSIYTLAYCKTLYAIDSLMQAKDYSHGIQEIEKIRRSHLFRDNRSLLFKEFVCYRNDGQIDSAYRYMVSALTLGLYYINYNNFEKEILIFDTTRNALIKSAFKSNAKLYHIDSTLLLQIETMYLEESTLRKLNIDSNDRVHLPRLKNIVDLYGWPGITKLGIAGDQKLWLLVQHADRDADFQKVILKLIESSLLENNTNPTNYAYLFDRICVNEHREQLFGTQFCCGTCKDSSKLCPLSDPENVGYYRVAFGLSTLEDYMNNFKHHVETSSE
jgi:hypothetical protein